MAEMKLPAGIAELRPSLGEVVELGLRHAPYFSVLLSSKHGLNIRVEDREERIGEQPPTAGTVLTAFNGATSYERAILGFKRDEIQLAARRSFREASSTSYVSPPGPDRRGDFATPLQVDPLELPTLEKLERCREVHRRVRGRDPRIVNVRVAYSERSDHSVFADASTDLAQRVQRVHMFIMVIVAAETGEVRYDYTAKSGSGGWEVLAWSDDELQQTVDNALALLSAERIEPGEYRIIAAPEVSGVIAHESFGHGVETDMFLKERARAVHFIDKVVGSPLVNISDDPSQPGGYGSYFFDDEGLPSAPTQIVENGVFRRGITDRYSAAQLGIPRSANGRRQDYSRKAYARMSNTFFAPGASTLDEMIAQVDHGIFLDKCSSGMEDPQGWGIQVTCDYGHEIKGGKITGRVFAPIGVSGYVPDVLQSITAVGDTLVMAGGGCGKGHKEWIPVATGGPHLLLTARLG
jgi:TldD protein